MAKTFGGFTPQQQQTLLSKMGYTGPAQQDDMNKFMMSSPKAASMMGKYAEMAKARVEGGPQMAMQVGGTVVGKGGQYFIKDAQGGYSQPYSTALDAYYANKGQTTNPTTGATVQPYAGLNTGTADNTPNTTGTGQQGQGNMAGTTGGTNGNLGTANDLNFGGITPLPNPNPDLEFPDLRRDSEIEQPIEEPVYDPSQGLPTAPVMPETADINQEVKDQYTSGFANWAGGLKEMVNSGNIPEDLSDPEFDYANKTVTFKDGTQVKLTMGKFDDEGPRVLNYIKQIEDYRDNVLKKSPAMDEYNKKKELYDQQLEQYKQYQSGEGEAGKSLENPTEAYNQAKTTLATEENLLNNYTQQLASMAADDPNRSVIEGLIEEQKVKITNAQAAAATAKSNLESVGMPSTTELRATALDDPESLVTKADVATFTDEERAAGKIAEGTGQAPTTATQATLTKAADSEDIAQAADIGTVTYDATMVTDKAKAELEKAKAARLDELSPGSTFEGEQGIVSTDSLASEINKIAEERILKVNEKVNLEVTKQQLAEVKGKNLQAIESKIAESAALKDAVAATSQVQPEELPPAAQIAEDQMAQAKAMVDAGVAPEADPVAAKLAKFTVDDGTLALAMEGEVSALATVEGQLSQLMKDFDDGTPAWAAGAIRAANAAMASRGLGASSMAGAAILQAAMESALPIAQQDANTFAQMDMQNLNNRQQVALSNAAAQQGLSLANLNNEQQANLQRSAQAFALQEANLSNRQAAEIANAQIRASLQGQNLTQQQQSNIAIAARFAEQANLNLNNKQQAAMQTNANQLQTNLANLSSKSQAYITNANLAASLQGQVLSNEQQVSIQNAARFAEAANISFTTQQQNALHNSKLMETVGLAELDADMAATLQNAATYASMDMANLNNRQQAAVQNAKAFLEMDMANLNNQQQMAMFKAQATQQALLSDQAAENAAKQFNAQSENQTNQFMANLNTQIKISNQEQKNKVNMFNAGEANAISVANANAQNARDQFNASSELVVAQANTQWEQTIATTENAEKNAANREAAAAANNMTDTTYNNMLQQERDAMDYVMKVADREDQQEHALTLNEINNDAAASAAKGSAVGTIVATAGTLLLKKAIGI